MAENRIRKDSFIKNTAIMDGLFLDYNILPSMPKYESDEAYVIDYAFNERPDLLAHALYGNSRLWWVFALRNPDSIEDPVRDFKAGTKIYLPTKETVNIVAESV
jgi:hypothetical protein